MNNQYGQLELASLTADSWFLTSVAYSSAQGLVARQAIYENQVPHTDFVTWTVDRLKLCGTENVVDVGCGNGRFIELIRNRGHRGTVFGVDLSPGILSDVPRRADAGPILVNGDIQRLPFADDLFDVVLSMQMLHHVPDIPAGLAELDRIRAPRGRVVVGVNGERHLKELDDLMIEAVAPHEFPFREHRFGLPNCLEALEAAFDVIERQDLHAELVLRDSTPAIRYLMSMGRLRWTLVKSGVDLLRAFTRAREIIDGVIRREGCFRVATHVAILECS